jgi:hypothetical protein
LPLQKALNVRATPCSRASVLEARWRFVRVRRFTHELQRAPAQALDLCLAHGGVDSQDKVRRWHLRTPGSPPQGYEPNGEYGPNGKTPHDCRPFLSSP